MQKEVKCPCVKVEQDMGYIGERNQNCCFACRLQGSHSDSCSCTTNRTVIKAIIRRTLNDVGLEERD